MARKTFDVTAMREAVNRQLARPEVSEEYRKGMCSILEHVLHETGNYNGYNYVDWLAGGCDRWRADEAEAGRDLDTRPYLGPEYRRVYY
jgi:hypothetical protein